VTAKNIANLFCGMFTNGKKVDNLQNDCKILRRNNLRDYVIYEDMLTNRPISV